MQYSSLPLDQLASWARLNQILLNNVVVSSKIIDEQGNDKGGGLLATADLGPGDVVLTVPGDLVLSQAQIEQHAKTDRHLREVLEAVGPAFAQNPRKAILLFLLLQLTHSSPDYQGQNIGTSVPLTQYVQFLPKSIPLPTFYSTEERDLLSGTSLLDALDQKLVSLEKEFDHVKASTQQLPWCQGSWWSEEEEKNSLTVRDWKLVDALYRSRALELPRNIGDSMVPVLDMVNHASDDAYNARFEYGSDGEVLLIIRDNKTLRKGDEITIMYGCGGACEMIFSYGFLDEHARSAREMFLSLEMPSDDPLGVAKKRFAREAPGVRIFSDDQERIRWDSSFVWWACVNEEDGLDFAVAQTNNGARELQASWNGHQLTDKDDLKSMLDQDARKDVFDLRATVLVQQRVESQGSRLSNTHDAFHDLAMRRHTGDDDPVVDTIRRLRDLELELLLSSYQSLEVEKTQLLTSDTVRAYLGQDEQLHPSGPDEVEDYS